MRIRKVFVGGTSVVALFVAWQTIHAVGSHVPIEEWIWTPPTVAAGMDAPMMLAGHSDPVAVPPFDVLSAADGVTANRGGTPRAVDLSALRFFAEAGDEAAMAREIARLEAIHPGFAVPDALTRPRAGAAEAALWSLLAEGRTGEVRARIAILAETLPDYRPSPDLLAAIDAADARAAVADALADGRFAEAIAAAESAPHILTCEDPEHLWRLAEAYAGAGEGDRALAVHAYILTHCADASVRAGSLSRGIAVSAEGAREVLLPALEAAGRGEAEVADARRAILRAIVAADARGDASRPAGCEAIAAAGATRPGGPPTDEVAAELADVAEDADDAGVLGWHHYAAGRFEEAQRWFDEALRFEERLDAVEGAILALKARGERRQALAEAKARSGDDRLACIALGIAAEDLSEGRLEHAGEVEALALRLRSADAAQVVGWHYIDAGRPETARDWFARSVEWRPTEAGAMGLVVAADRMGDRNAARAAASRWGPLFAEVAAYGASMERRRVPVPMVHPARAVVETPAGPPMPLLPDPAARLLEEALAAYEAKDYARALERLDARRVLAGESRDLAMLRGWALHNSGASREAWRLFRALDAEQSTRETREATLHAWRAMMPNRFH